MLSFFAMQLNYFFLVSHSNAMRAYFTFVRLSVNYLNSEFSTYYKNEITAAIRTKLRDLGWIKREMEVEDSNDNDRDKEENYIEGSKGLDMTSVYRRALMSFVNHYAGLRILEQRSIALLADENIKLSLIVIKHPTLYYCLWEEMEKVIETCLDFHPSNSLGCPGIIAKIEEQVLEMTNSTNNVILAFKTLLKLKNSKPFETQPTYPPFSTCIHCESSLATILCQLHGNWISSLNASLLELFQASPFLHSSSLPDL